MQAICNLITRNMALLVLAAGVLGAAAPDACKWIGPHIPLLLGVVMFGMGMTLRVEDFRTLAKRPWEVAAGAVLQFTIMPFMAWATHVLQWSKQREAKERSGANLEK